MRLLAGVLAVIALAGAAASADAATIASVSGVAITSGAQTQTGQLSRDGVASTCAASKSTPPLSGLAGNFHFRVHTFRSSVANPVCVTVTVNPACGGPAIFSAAYAGTFVPADPRAAYAADMGSSATTPASYSFNIGGESPFAVVVHEAIENTGCASYGIMLTSDRPWATAPPFVGGDPRVGGTLTGFDATWAPAPSVQRQWRRCDADGGNCVDIPGATATTYTVTDADIGSTLRFVNVATDGGGTSTSQSRGFEAYIPFQERQGESLGTGDRTHSGTFARTGVADHCATPAATTDTVIFPTTLYLFDSFPVTSLLNEPACLVVRAVPNCFPDGVSTEIYTPSFDPAAGITANHAAHSGEPPPGPSLTSWRLSAGGNAEAVVSHGFNGSATCASYDVTLGADAPFASARPTIAGAAVEGGTLTATDGSWSGSPTFARSWLRCDGSGAACVPVDGATGPSYTPTSADVGRRLRARVTAVQGRAVSSDSEPSDVIAAAPVGPAGQPLDRAAPKATLRLGSRNLTRALKRGRIPLLITSDEQCAVRAQVRITRKLAKRLRLGKKIVIASAKGTARPGASKTLNAKLTKRARRALRGRQSLKVTLAATCTDGAGNAAKLKRNAALKRPRQGR